MHHANTHSIAHVNGPPERAALSIALKPPWPKFYRRAIAASDMVVLLVAVLVAVAVKFGFNSKAATTGPFPMSYEALGASIVIMWWAVLGGFRTRDRQIIGTGFEEYRRVVRATLLVFGWLAIASLIFKWDMSRGYLATTFPLGLLLLLGSRKAWRHWLTRRRVKGLCTAQVLVIGGLRSAAHIALMFDKYPGSGFRVTGVWIPDRASTPGQAIKINDRDAPVVGTEQTLTEALRMCSADSVVVTDTEHLGHLGLKELTWELEGMDVDLMVSPNVMDVSGSRIHLRAVASLPLLHVEEPQYAEAGAWPKLIFDRVCSASLLVLFLPLMLATATLVKCSGRGPVFYYQSRIGLGSEPFRVIKFRTMCVDSDAQLEELLKAQNTAETPLFKIRDDPRITRFGKVLRRYSIDELPQLINVLKGDMSLVGPRPQQSAEVDLYDRTAHRRLRVRPGMTGLWQTSGRSDLTWVEAIRLDIYYVENWSMTVDLLILWRTAKAVLRSDGAY